MRDGGAEAGQQEQTGQQEHTGGEAGTLAHSLTQSLTQSLSHSLSTENAGAGAVCCQFTFQTLHATSQDGSSLEFVAATAGRECNIQDARGRGLCVCSPKIYLNILYLTNLNYF